MRSVLSCAAGTYSMTPSSERVLRVKQISFQKMTRHNVRSVMEESFPLVDPLNVNRVGCGTIQSSHISCITY